MKRYPIEKINKDNDEYYTPEVAIKPILKYIKPSSTIWCPFDKEDSNFVKLLKEEGHKVLYSHIDTGENFFFYNPQEEYDYIISNPPFSLKDMVLKRLSELGKPYAMILPITALAGVGRFPYVKDCQALIFDKRINFLVGEEKTATNKVTFPSIYVCKNFLPKDLIFEKL